VTFDPAVVSILSSSVVAVVGIVVPALLRRGDRQHDLGLRRADHELAVQQRAKERDEAAEDRRVRTYVDALTYAQSCVRAARTWPGKHVSNTPVFPDEGDLRGRVAAWASPAVVTHFKELTDEVDAMALGVSPAAVRMGAPAGENVVQRAEQARDRLQSQIRSELAASGPAASPEDARPTLKGPEPTAR